MNNLQIVEGTKVFTLDWQKSFLEKNFDDESIFKRFNSEFSDINKILISENTLEKYINYLEFFKSTDKFVKQTFFGEPIAIGENFIFTGSYPTTIYDKDKKAPIYITVPPKISSEDENKIFANSYFIRNNVYISKRYFQSAGEINLMAESIDFGSLMNSIAGTTTLAPTIIETSKYASGRIGDNRLYLEQSGNNLNLTIKAKNSEKISKRIYFSKENIDIINAAEDVDLFDVKSIAQFAYYAMPEYHELLDKLEVE